MGCPELFENESYGYDLPALCVTHGSPKLQLLRDCLGHGQALHPALPKGLLTWCGANFRYFVACPVAVL